MVPVRGVQEAPCKTAWSAQCRSLNGFPVQPSQLTTTALPPSYPLCCHLICRNHKANQQSKSSTRNCVAWKNPERKMVDADLHWKNGLTACQVARLQIGKLVRGLQPETMTHCS